MNLSLAVLLGVILGVVSLVLQTPGGEPPETVTDEEVPSIVSPEPTPVATPTPSPTLVPTPTMTPLPTPTPVPARVDTSEEIQGFMERFAGQYGVDANVLRKVAVCESGFNPLAVNGGYAGLYQFGPTAWRNNRALMGEDPDLGLRFDAAASVQTAAYVITIGRGSIWPNCFPQ